MKYILLILCLFQLNLNLYAQDIELEDVDDLSILDEFDKEESGIEDSLKPDEEEAEEVEIGDVTEEDNIDDLLEDIDESEASETASKTEDDFSKEEKDLEENLDFLNEDFKDEKEVAEGKEPELKELGLDESDLDEIDALAGFEIEQNPLQVNQEGDEEINFKLIQEFSKYSENNYDEVILNAKRNKENVYSNFEIEALKTQLKDILGSDLRLAYLARGTRLTRIKDGKVVYTTRPVTVRVYTQPDYNKDRYIIDKNGHLLYKTFYKKVSDIKRISDLYRKPHKFVRYPKKTIKRNINDKSFPYSILVNAHVGLNIPNYTDDLLEVDSAVAPLFRAELILMSQKNLRFNTGLSLNYETLTGILDNTGTYQQYSFSIGPHFKLNEFWGDIALIVQPRVSIFSELAAASQNNVDTLKLTETSFLLGLESDNKIKNYGTMVLGFSAQRKWINTSTQNADYSIGDSTRSDDSFTIYIGHRSDWIW